MVGPGPLGCYLKNIMRKPLPPSSMSSAKLGQAMGVYVDYHNAQWRVLVNLSYDNESVFLHQCHKNIDALYGLIYQDLSKHDIKGKKRIQ